MVKTNPTLLPVAIRVFPALKSTEAKSHKNKIWRLPRAMFVFDTETRTDASQRLTFGSYRFFVDNELQRRGYFFADDLPSKDRKTLEKYVAATNSRENPAPSVNSSRISQEVVQGGLQKPRSLGRLQPPVRLVSNCLHLTSSARTVCGRILAGDLVIHQNPEWKDPQAVAPASGIKHIDSKRALKGFTARFGPDDSDLIPENSATGQPEKGYKFRGHMLDLRTLAFALTDRAYSLDSACRAFVVEHGKQHVTRHGVVTKKYIDYNRRDVLATSELATKLLAEYAKHPINLQPTKAFSPASIGKAYLRAMGINPILERQPDFPTAYLGFAQTAFFGGRTSAHIRKVPVPVSYVDFLSMYPTVNGLMDLRRFLIAREVRVVEHCQAN